MSPLHIKFRMFCIPEEQRALCSGEDIEIVSALYAIGFDFDGKLGIPGVYLNDHDEGAGWKQVTASIISKLSLSIEKNEDRGSKDCNIYYPLRSDGAIILIFI